MVIIVSPEEIIEGTINQELIDLSETAKGKKEIEKYERIVANKIFSKIDSEQFLDGNEYIIPEDLKLAAISLIDSFYTYAVVNGENSASRKLTSRKIDDYSETFSENTSAFMYFGIPTDGDVLDILKKYMRQDERGFWDINLN